MIFCRLCEIEFKNRFGSRNRTAITIIVCDVLIVGSKNIEKCILLNYMSRPLKIQEIEVKIFIASVNSNPRCVSEN